jgi:hypothetical protein
MANYYPSSLRGCCLVAGGLFFIGVGLCGIYVNGFESLWFWGGFCLVGVLIGVVVGIAILTGRVVLEEQGIATYHLWRLVHKIPWDNLEGWSVKSSRESKTRYDDSFTFKMVEFTLRDGRVISIFDDEVGLPNFEHFLAELRRVASEKECIRLVGNARR